MYDQPGSAAEYVYLPQNPDFEKTNGYDNGRMYGAEYHGTFFGTPDEDVSCAVCRKVGSTSVLMIPGKNKFFNGWTIEYHGYLGSGGLSHTAASSSICVDSHPEYLNGGSGNDWKTIVLRIGKVWSITMFSLYKQLSSYMCCVFKIIQVI